MEIKNLNKMRVRKVGNKYTIFVEKGFKTKEIFLHISWNRGGSDSLVLQLTKLQDVAEVLNNPIKVVCCTEGDILISTRVLFTTLGTFWRLIIPSKVYTREEFVALHPEYFI